jgi:lysyl-tRNA synthetase class 2
MGLPAQRARTPVRVERHAHGPRVFVLGHRIHECAAGAVVLGVAVAFALAGLLSHGHAAGASVVGAWLVIKDWRDLFPSKRDTAAWRLGIHRRFAALRPARRSARVPQLAGLAVLVTAALNVASALTPSAHWRLRLLSFEPVDAIPLFHALALPAGAALAVIAFYLWRRRRRAIYAAVVVLPLLGVFNLLKGVDVEEAALCWALAGGLWWARHAFDVHHEPLTRRSALWRGLLLVTAMWTIALTAVAVAAPTRAGVTGVLNETAALLTWNDAGVPLGDLDWLRLGVPLLGVWTLIAAAYLLFRPLALPHPLPGRDARRAAFSLVRAHGRDTLSFFKLRRDTNHFFAADGRAFLGYRVESGVLLVSGDPVGPPDAIPGLLRELCAFAELRGLKIAVLGAGAELLPLYEQAGLRAFYIGDEAIVDTSVFSLEGRAVRKVRQSVNRLLAGGYTAEVLPAKALSQPDLEQLERVSQLWRAGAPERGFSMAMDAIACDDAPDGLVVTARDPDGRMDGFLHFVPSYGRAAMSLSHMRRDPATPNGLMEFLVVQAIELLRERGVEEISLNFAAFARLLHSPRNRSERLLARLVTLGNPFFQIESLYRFNAKFFPRWVPRYLLYEGPLGLPRAGLAAMRIEGQVPNLRPKA